MAWPQGVSLPHCRRKYTRQAHNRASVDGPARAGEGTGQAAKHGRHEGGADGSRNQGRRRLRAAGKQAHFLKETHRRIRGAASAEAIHAILRRAESHELDALALTAAFHRMAILQVESQRVARTDPSMRGRCRLAHGANEDMLRLERMAVAKIGEFGFQEVALTLWALAKMSKLTKSKHEPTDATNSQNHAGGQMAPLLAVLLERATDTASTARPRNIANIMWACATLGLQPSSALLAVLSRRIISTADAFGSQAIANILWAFASLRLKPAPELARAVMHRAAQVAPVLGFRV
jgi:hypothetical protein